MGKLSEVPLINKMDASQSFIVDAGGLKRITMANVRDALGDYVTSNPAEYVLEQSSNPAFEVANQAVAKMYVNAMGGYMFRIKNGKVYAAKLSKTNWGYFADGSKVDDASKYETMVRVPDCYYKGDDRYMKFGGLSPVAGGHKFGSPNWVGAYLMYVDANSIGHSRPGVAPSHSKTMSQFDAYAKALSPEFGLANYGFHCLINAVYQAYYGNLDSQTTIGSGFQHSKWEDCRDVPMGKTISLGDGSGKVLYNDSNLGNQYPVKLFGFEDLWGKLWEFRPGIRFFMQDDKRYAVVYNGNIVSNTATGRQFEMILPQSTGTDGSAASSMVLGEYWDMVCKSQANGATSKYYADGWWEATGGQLLFVGGTADYGLSCGLSCANSSYGFSRSWTNIGARLAFYGLPELVSGSELMAM